MSELILKKGGVSDQKTLEQDPLQVLNQLNNNKLLPLLAIMDKSIPIISQIVGFKIMRELFDHRDNIRDPISGELPTPIPSINRQLVYFMNMIAIQQFFQESNDLGRTFASGILTANYGGNLFFGMAEANISSLWGTVSDLVNVPKINWDSLANDTWENILSEVKGKFNISGVPSF